tara:strand:+ start:1465 stop:1827 length:363 start_codon:yes stop_codon:yes gene_type:complete
MKKDVENEIEELLEQIENKYQNHNNSSLLDYVVSIIKKLNIVKIFSSILIIILSILMITNGVITLESLVILGVFLIIIVIGFSIFRQYQRPVKRWRGEIIEDYYNRKTVIQIIKSFFTKK